MKDRDKELIIKIKSLEKNIKTYKAKNKLLYYNSDRVHKKQIEFHKCTKRNRWVFGGNRSGKTECGAVEVVWLARGNHPYKPNKDNVSGWVVSLSTQVQRDVAQSKILNYLNPDWIIDVVMISGKSTNPKGGVIDYITVRNIFGGVSKIGFKSCESGRDKFQGASLDFVWFDEEPPKDIYDECRMRVIDKKGEIFGTMTPLQGLTFIYNKIYLNEDNDKEIYHISMEWADNPYLDTDEIESVSATMSEDELASRRYGKFSSSSGLVYYEFDPSIHVIEPFDVPKEWQDTMSIDPGLNNPLSCHWYAISGDGVVYVMAEHYEKGKDIDYHAQCIKNKCKEIGWKSDYNNRYVSLIDSASSQRTLASSNSVAELFCERGILVNTKVNKDLFSGIAQVKSYLKGDKTPKLYIFNSCTNLIREFKSYFWASGDRPGKKDDHALDELRYYLMTRPRAKEEKTVKSEIALDKDRLLRRVRKGRQ